MRGAAIRMSVSTTDAAGMLAAVEVSVPQGRDFVRSWLRSRPQHYDEDSAVLLTSELLTNALQHATGAFEIRVSDRPGWLRVEVVDETPDAAPVLTLNDVQALDDHGRGLQLVNSLADRWGSHVLTHSGGIRTKVVWFELAAVGSAQDNGHRVPHQPQHRD